VKGRTGLAIRAAVCLAAVVSAAGAARAAGSTDEQVDTAIRRGLAYLYRHVKADVPPAPQFDGQHPGGAEALLLYTALCAGEDPSLPALAVLKARLEAADPQTVYARALRALAYSRLPGGPDRDRAVEDVRWLVQQMQSNGGWGYGPDHPTTRTRRDWTDTSNSQLATLALCQADPAGQATTAGHWKRVNAYWLLAQNSDGGWGYAAPPIRGVRLRADSYGTMTAGAVAACLHTLDALARDEEAPLPSRRRAPNAPTRQQLEPLDKALRWLDKNYAVDSIPRWGYGINEHWLQLYLYNLARAANAAGLARLGGNDWREQMTAFLLAQQQADGSWVGPVGPDDAPIRTCFAILALREARRTVLIQKLALDGPFSLDCRDAANATRWLETQLRRPLAWQSVDPADPAAIGGAGIVYLCGTGELRLPAPLGAKLVEHVKSGGVVLVQAFAGDRQFAASAGKAFADLLHAAPPVLLPKEHPVLTAPHRVDGAEIAAITVKGRQVVFVATSDLSGRWHQQRADERNVWAFEALANLAAYAEAGRALAAGPTTKKAPPPPPPPPAHRVRMVRQISVARVRHGDGWDACPRAMDRLSDVLARAVSMGVWQERETDLSSPVPAGVPLLWLTGTTRVQLSELQKRNLRDYVRRGGTVFLDPTAGGDEWFVSARKTLEETFGAKSVAPVPPAHPLVTGAFGGGAGADLTTVRYRPAAAKRVGQSKAPVLWGVVIDGRLAVILSPYGVTAPLAGTAPADAPCLETDDARRLVANVTLYAVAEEKSSPGRAVTTQPRTIDLPPITPKAKPTRDDGKTIFDF